MSRFLISALLLTAFTVLAIAAPTPESALAAVCADYPNQAAARAAADTRDADGDGIYCESLPCPCASGTTPAPSPTPAPPPTPAPAPAPEPKAPAECTKPKRVQNISFSKTKYPNIRRHFLDALSEGWPRILVLNRPGADARRDRLLESYPAREGFDRDEYPPAVGRGKGRGLTKGSSPRGWRADVRYVPSSENRSHGSTLGIKLRRFCDGTRFQYVFY
jgi:hypothetical protein